MKFIYKNVLVEVILNLDANKIMAFCSKSDTSKAKTVKKSGKTIKILNYKDLKPIKFTIVESIHPLNEIFTSDNANDNLANTSIMKKICNKIDEQIG
ncbi:MAG: hypothetical protein FIA82_04900 [Melioribacter sp.]|nr:hypothetical protein [Melioribacter sp.]